MSSLKPHDVQRLRVLGRFTTGRLPSKLEIANMLHEGIQIFFQELCSLAWDAVEMFNATVEAILPDACCGLLQLAMPRFGLIVLKGREKLVLSLEVSCVWMRVVQLDGLVERTVRHFSFVPEQDSLGLLTWWYAEEKQMVTPELIVQHYVSLFLASGCKAYPHLNTRLVALS